MSSDHSRDKPQDGTTQDGRALKRRDVLLRGSSVLAASALSASGLTSTAHAQQPAVRSSGQRPNIVFIMGDDIGWFNIGAYHQGIMAGRTPNLDKLASRGHALHRLLRRGELHGGTRELHHRRVADPHRADDRRPGGRAIGMPAEAPTIATVLKSMGYATGQFGKNHLGDLNEFLPTVHGFDEFFGYLYHLDAMEDPSHRNYPQAAQRQGRSAQHGPFLGHRP